MRQFVVDNLSINEREYIKNYLEASLTRGPIEGMYWLPLPPELLGEAQQGHEKCGPFYLCVELGEDVVSFELLVRSQSNLHCSCINYATQIQRDFLLQFIDRLLDEGNIVA